MEVVYVIPTLIFAPAFILLVVAVAIGGLFLTQRLTPQGVLREHNDIVGFLIAVVGVIYAVALAFLVIVVWEGFNEAERTVVHEVDALTDIYHGVQVFPAPDRDRLRLNIKRYNSLMLHEEWPAMKDGRVSVTAQAVALDIARDVTDLNPVGNREIDEHNELLTLTEKFLDSRRERLHMNVAGLPQIMWWTMTLGGVLTIGFAYLFGGVNRTLHAVMVGLLAATVAAMLVLVIEINLPFRGDTAVSDHIWHTQIEQLEASDHPPSR